MLTVTNLKKIIDGKEVLKDISFTIEKGTITGLVGRNGVGKTTLLRSLVGILDPEHGEILYEGQSIFANPEVKRYIAYVPDSMNIFNSYSVKELIHLYKIIYVEFETESFYALMERFKLPTTRKIRGFSKGMKALLSIILAVSTNAKLIILDEPTNGLDAIVKRQILKFLIEEVSEREISLLISTHHLDELEKIADTIMFMKEGQLESIITMDDAKQYYKKVQVVFKTDFPPFLSKLENIRVVKKIGRVRTVLITGNTDEMIMLLKKENPILLEELPLSLEDMFITALGGDELV